MNYYFFLYANNVNQIFSNIFFNFNKIHQNYIFQVPIKFVFYREEKIYIIIDFYSKSFTIDAIVIIYFF